MDLGNPEIWVKSTGSGRCAQQRWHSELR